MFERYENSLHAIRIELEDAHQRFGLHAVVGDVTDPIRVEEVMRSVRARDRLPRGGAQARAADGGESVRGHQEQRARARGCSPRRPRSAASTDSS